MVDYNPKNIGAPVVENTNHYKIWKRWRLPKRNRRRITFPDFYDLYFLIRRQGFWRLGTFGVFFLSFSFLLKRKEMKEKRTRQKDPRSKTLTKSPLNSHSRQRLTDGQGPGIHPSDVFVVRIPMRFCKLRSVISFARSLSSIRNQSLEDRGNMMD